MFSPTATHNRRDAEYATLFNDNDATSSEVESYGNSSNGVAPNGVYCPFDVQVDPVLLRYIGVAELLVVTT